MKKVIKESYSYSLFETLVEKYSGQYHPNTHETIWKEIYDQYKDEDLANDVITALEEGWSDRFESLKLESANESQDEELITLLTKLCTEAKEAKYEYEEMENLRKCRDILFYLIRDAQSALEYVNRNFTEELKNPRQESLKESKGNQYTKFINKELKAAGDLVEETYSQISVQVDEEDNCISYGFISDKSPSKINVNYKLTPRYIVKNSLGDIVYDKIDPQEGDIAVNIVNLIKEDLM